MEKSRKVMVNDMDLIDRDALIPRLASVARLARSDQQKALCGRMLFVVQNAPTVEPKQEWISVKDRLPEEHESIFHKFFGTLKWLSTMWKQESDNVLVCVSFPDGTSVVTTGCLHNSDWMTTVSKTLPQIVTHWMPLPEPPKLEGGETDEP